MKPFIPTLGAAAIGFLIGFGFPVFQNHPAPQQTKISSTRSVERTRSQPTDRLQKFAGEATTLTPAQWPSFFRTRLSHPDGTHLAERLWAEQDPAGFWKWLIEQRDAATLKNYGADLLRVWAAADPDAAMAAASAITDKSSSDFLRTAVIESLLATDLQKGIALAAQTPDFNRFSWGPRGWMNSDPSAVVQGLATLPASSEYRSYLTYAVEAWAKQDTPALLAWLKTEHAPDKEDWYQIAFKSAASSNTQAALDAANHLTDPTARSAAVTGVLSSGKIPIKDIIAALPSLTLQQQYQAANDAIQNSTLQTADQFAEATQLLLAAPANKNLLNSVDRIADKFKNWDDRLKWAGALPDSALRRKAMESIAFGADEEQLDRLAATVSTVSLLDLSDHTFGIILNRLPEDKRDVWIEKLPPDRAAWARSTMNR